MLAILHLSAHATPFVIGLTNDGTGDIVENLVNQAGDLVNIQVIRGSASDIAFFDQIDAFIFADGFGSSANSNSVRSSLGATGRANLFNFVLGGGHAYLGIEAFIETDGAEIATLFNIGQSDRIFAEQFGTILDPLHPIASGPFQPAVTYLNVVFRALSLPSNAIELGRSPQGTTLGFFAEGSLSGSSGQVYFFADEVPLADNNIGHKALLANALFGFGATTVPEPSTLAGLAIGLIGFAGLTRKRDKGRS